MKASAFAFVASAAATQINVVFWTGSSRSTCSGHANSVYTYEEGRCQGPEIFWCTSDGRLQVDRYTSDCGSYTGETYYKALNQCTHWSGTHHAVITCIGAMDGMNSTVLDSSMISAPDPEVQV